MKLLIVIAALLAAPAIAHAQAAPDCGYDRAKMLALDQDTFDQQPGGFRAVADKPGCEAAAADLIAAYRTANAVALVNGPLDKIKMLDWHEGQLRALVGQRDQAIRLMLHTWHPSDDWGAYVDPTIAFLKRDKPALLKARDRLAGLPKPAWFDGMAASFTARTGSTITWPTNLDVVDGLVACFDKPYTEAYGMACRPAQHAQKVG